MQASDMPPAILVAESHANVTIMLLKCLDIQQEADSAIPREILLPLKEPPHLLLTSIEKCCSLGIPKFGAGDMRPGEELQDELLEIHHERPALRSGDLLQLIPQAQDILENDLPQLLVSCTWTCPGDIYDLLVDHDI